MGTVAEKVVWITGSGRGIGRATALALAEKGARIVLSARTKAEIEAVNAEIASLGGTSVAIPCDGANKKAVGDLVARIKASWGAIDILINNAGIAVFRKIVDTSEEDWDAMMNANLKSAFLCSQAVLPGMMERKAGHIINVVSVSGKQPYYNCGGYCASKYGLLGLTDVLRLEGRKHGIRVTAFLPGATDTNIWGHANVDRSKMMKPEQVARALAAICESDSGASLEEVMLRPIGGDL